MNVAGLMPSSFILKMFREYENLSYRPTASGVKTLVSSISNNTGIWLVCISFRGEGVEHGSTYMYYNIGGIYAKSIEKLSGFDYDGNSSVIVTAAVT